MYRLRQGTGHRRVINREHTPSHGDVSGRASEAGSGVSVVQTRPLTGSSAPVTALAASLARKRMTLASSFGATHLAGSAFGMLARFAAVSMIDGSTAFTVILPFSSAASDSVSLCTPAFDAA